MSLHIKNIIILTGLSFAILFAASPGHAQSGTQSVTDIRQEVQIWTTFSLNPYLRVSDLKVSVTNGTATLTGRVPEEVNKQLATEIARGVEGIKDVNNQITVEAEHTPAVTAIRNYAELIEDASITTAIKSKLLWSKYTDGLKTTVTTKAGRVTLEGTAESPAALDLAGQLASNTRGVVSVNNLLTIASAPTLTGTAEHKISDAWITTKVKSTLLYSSDVAGSDIEVNTKNGVVTLSGKLGSAQERARAINLAQNIKGVKSVIANDLTF